MRKSEFKMLEVWINQIASMVPGGGIHPASSGKIIALPQGPGSKRLLNHFFKSRSFYVAQVRLEFPF